MTALTRDAILGADDIQREKVKVPEWGGYVYISTMSGADRDAYEASIFKFEENKSSSDMRNIRAKLVAASAVGDDGARLFSEGDVEALGKKSAAALERCFSVASRLNRLSKKDVEDLAKNS